MVILIIIYALIAGMTISATFLYLGMIKTEEYFWISFVYSIIVGIFWPINGLIFIIYFLKKKYKLW